MKRFSFYLIIICFFWASSSCVKNEIGDELREIQMSFSQRLNHEDGIWLDIKFSGGRFECENVSLEYKLDRTEKTIFLTFGKSYLTNNLPCISHNDNTYSAKGTIALENLPVGNYAFVINNLDETHYAGITNDGKKITITNPKGPSVSFVNEPERYLIPKDAWWGHTSGYPDSLQHLLLDSLISLGAVHYASILSNGNYGSFKVSNGNYYLDSFGYDDDTYLLKMTLDSTTVQGVLDYFDNLGVHGTLYNGTGDRFD